MQRRVILYADELQPSDFDAVAAFKLIEQRRKRLGYIGHEWEAADLYRVRR
jgi:hypothetical protein